MGLRVAGPAPPQPPSQPPSQDDDDQDQETEPETELARQMTLVEEGLRRLRRSVRKGEQNAASLETIAACEAALLACKAQTPAMAARVPEGEREAFLRDYRLEMVGALEAFLDLERALLEGRQDELRDLYKRIAALEDPAHERFTEGD